MFDNLIIFKIKTKNIFFDWFFIFFIEHTWGLPSVYDYINWSNEDFEKVINTQSFNNCLSAWLEQREFFNIYLETVREHPVYNIIEDELRRTFNGVTRPNLNQFRAVSPTETFVLFSRTSNPIQVKFNESLGSIANLSRSDTIYWTDENSQLATYVYITYNETDFVQLSNTYGNPGKMKKKVIFKIF